MIPGEYLLAKDPITCNDGRKSISVQVLNTGDRPVQVGSHYHFAEVNPALIFDRATAWGKRLDIPAGTAVRFEPGDQIKVRLVDLAGNKAVYGLRNHVNGTIAAHQPPGAPWL